MPVLCDFGGIITRDAFNGLRLWHRDLGRGDHNAESFKLPRLSYSIARPVASAKYARTLSTTS